MNFVQFVKIVKAVKVVGANVVAKRYIVAGVFVIKELLDAAGAIQDFDVFDAEVF